MREPTIYISTDGSVPSQRYAIDDPAIIEALAIAQAARDAGLVENGKLRTILGQVSVTADGAIVGHHHATVYYIDRRGNVKSSTLYHRGIAKDCYSTRSAAEAAKGGGDA
jgi:hypothetical protein